MIIVIDAGNTNITLGVFEQEQLLATFRITTKMTRTSDEFGVLICELLERKGFSKNDVNGIIIASVVPNIMYSLKNGLIKFFDINPLIVGPGTKTGIKIVTENPREIGADRIVDAVGAYELYGGPVLVLDFGTATTYDLITEDGSFIAGVTSPGIGISARALWNDAAKLPEIEIKKPKSILARETISSMQAGLVYGYIGQTEYIVQKMIEESKIDNVKVIATGGLGRIIAEETDKIDIYDPKLTLEGLRLIYNRNIK